MRCEQAQEALIDARYDAESSSELAAHLGECATCRAFQAREIALDGVLALDEPAVVRPGFDTRFFARLDAEKARARRKRFTRFYWALVPLAAGAVLVLLRPAQVPHAPDSAMAKVPAGDLGLAMELDLVENIAVVQKLDEVEAYDLLDQLDEGELERIAQEGK
jgi:predicted anti-sigma-YlaC factor YlaD